ncbi:DUF4340 domain-containing protein [Bacteroidota bacterium]
MKKNRLYLIIFVVLLVVAAILIISNSKVTLSKELRDFAIEDTASITKIYMANKSDQEVVLDKDENNQWFVNGKYPVRKESIDLILKTINRIEVRAPVSDAARDNTIRNLAGRSTKVEIYKKNKLLKVFYVGGATQDQRGTFLMIEGSTTPFVAHIPGFSGYLSSRFFIDEELWRDPGIFRYNSDDIKTVNIVNTYNPEQSFKLSRLDDGKFNLVPISRKRKPEEFDSLSVLHYTNQFKNICWEFVINKTDPVRKDSILSTLPLFTITVEDMTGNVNSVTAYTKPADGKEDMDGNPLEIDDERMLAIINGENNFYTIQYNIFDRIFVEYDSLLPKTGNL